MEKPNTFKKLTDNIYLKTLSELYNFLSEKLYKLQQKLFLRTLY